MSASRARPLLALALALSACGYHLAHSPADPLGPFAIVSGPVHVPAAAAIAAAEDGARAELGRAGALGTGGTVEIELLRLDETSEGIAVTSASPFARGIRVTAIGRARLRRAGSATVERDTGDVRTSEVLAAGNVVAGVLGHDEATRAAARRLGEVLVRKLLGFPEPGEP